MTGSIEIFIADGVLTGGGADVFDLRERLESSDEFALPDARWSAFAGAPAPDARALPVDEIVAAAGTLDPNRVVHANWHDVILEAGPYRIDGLLPVLPGFDPGRALTRPGGTFIQLRQVRLGIVGRVDAGELERDAVLVNRYAVDRVTSDLELTFFFPAAEFVTLQGAPLG
jgi:hypothetical protein